ncbi:tape measure protein [Mycobacterium phage Cambiare]|uniref:Tape measure protein n=1 Tax=Mycobacterium phage Cambiare TaxID=1647305 RepID=A0A0F6WEB4_9CAUD|nr:endolysin [Mycobacterium phage Cambiare]AKF14519.1 tape measure protein [Mycobacterium phage Cambiare]
MQGTYWLTVLPETSKLRPGIKRALAGVDTDAVVRPRLDTSNMVKGAKAAGQRAGADVAAGVEQGAGRGGGLGRLLRIDNARSTGQRAGSEVNAGLAASNIGAGASAQLERNLTSGASGMGSRLGSLIGGGLSTAMKGAGVLAAAGIGGALTAGFKRLTAIDDAKFKLQGLGNTGEQVQSIMDNALAAVKGTAFGLDEAATTAASAVAAGIKPGEELTNYLKLTSDTAAIAGTNLADMGGIFNSVQTSGKAMTGDLRMLADRGLPVFTWLQEATGKTGEDFNKFVEEGGISAQMFRDAVANNIAGAAQNMGGSVRGSLSNLKAAFSRFGAELSGPIFAGLKPLAIGLTGVFDSVTAAIKPIMADLTARVGPWADALAAKMKAWADNGGMEKLVAWFGQLRDTVAGFISGSGGGGASSTMQSIADSAKAIGPALQQSGPALAGFGEAAKQFGLALAAVGPETLSGVMVPALNLLAGALKFVADNASWAVPAIGGLVLAFGGFRMLEKTVAPVVAALNGAFRIINAPIMLAQTAAIRAQAKAMEELTVALGANAVAQTTQATAATGAAVATGRGRIATLAAAAASKVATAAQWLWNAALTANPIGLIVAAVVAAGVAIWAFFTKTETGRKLWDKIWTGIKTTVSVVWNWLKTTLANAWTQIGPSVMKIADVAKQAFGAFGNAIKQVWQFIQPAIEWIGRLWLSVQKLNFQIAIGALKALGAVIGWLWTNVVVPAFSGIATAVQTWWAGVQVVWAAAKVAIQAVGDVISWLWQSVAVPAFEAIKTAVTTWWDGVKFVWDLFDAGVHKVGDGIDWLKGAFETGFNAIKGVVETVWNFISGIFDKIKNGVGNIVDKLRSIPGIGSLIPGAAGGGQAPGFAGGSAGVSSTGVISGPGTGTSDSILARVSNGEGIVTADAMQKGGAPIVAALNAGWVPPAGMLRDMLPGFAEGLVTADQLVDFAKGVEGQPYKWGGVNWGDCSGAVSAIANYATGQDPFGSRFATASEGDELAKRGFLPGMGGSGDLSIGWYNGGPGGGHTAATLPDGTNFEMGGARGNGQFGGSAAGAGDSQFTNQMHLPAEYFAGLDGATGSTGGSIAALGGSTSAGGSSAAHARKVQTAQTTVKNAGQAVDDATYRRDRAQQRVDDLKAQGKDTTDAQHSLDVANRELTDAKEKQTRATDRLTEIQNEAVKADDSGAGAKSVGGGFDDLGKSLWGGLMETIGLDGSVFSNPFEWPTVKSAMAGINWLGKEFLGDGTDTAGGTGGGTDLLGGILGGASSTTGLDALANLNPAAAGVEAAPASAVAPDTTQHGAGNGAAPGPGVYIENAGMSPTDVANKLEGTLNARTRTTKVH